MLIGLYVGCLGCSTCHGFDWDHWLPLAFFSSFIACRLLLWPLSDLRYSCITLKSYFTEVGLHLSRHSAHGPILIPIMAASITLSLPPLVPLPVASRCAAGTLVGSPSGPAYNCGSRTKWDLLVATLRSKLSSLSAIGSMNEYDRLVDSSTNVGSSP